MSALLSPARSALATVLTPVTTALSLARSLGLLAPACDCQHPTPNDNENGDSSSSASMSRDVPENANGTANGCERCDAASSTTRNGADHNKDDPPKTFADLPDKVLEHMFHIINQTSRHDLCNVSLVSKRFHLLADKVLFKNLLFDSPEQHLIFSETLDRRPRRGSIVQDVTLQYPSSELSHLILDAPLDRSHYSPERIDGLSRTLSTMSNLERLDIAVPDRLLHGIGTLFNGPFDFANLKTCALFFECPDKAYWDLQECIHVFTNPTIESLTIKRAKLDERGFDSLERPHSTALRSLHLIECDINDDALADIMEFPEALREFVMVHDAYPEPELEESSDEINEFVMALKPCAETLETIVIDHPTLGGRKVLRLRDFVAVKTLRLNFDTQLFGKTSKKPRLHSVGFPPALETLEFLNEIGRDDVVTELFAGALENVEFMARNLKTLMLVDGPRGIPRQVLDACEGKPFELSLRKLDSDDED